MKRSNIVTFAHILALVILAGMCSCNPLSSHIKDAIYAALAGLGLILLILCLVFIFGNRKRIFRTLKEMWK